jgi:cell volume regulation protein A
MHEVHDFGVIVLLVATAFALAVLTSRLSERFRVPGPALFLIAAALLSDLFPSLGDLSIRTVERIGVVALVVILFDGGSRIGLRRLRTAAVPVLSLGVIGTFATAGLTTLAAHWLLDF